MGGGGVYGVNNANGEMVDALGAIAESTDPELVAQAANNGLHPTTVDQYNPMHPGKTTLRDSKWFCSTHVTIDQATGAADPPHKDLFNPEPTQNQASPTLFWLHFIYDGTPDFIYRKTGMYLVPAGRGLCQ